MPKPSKRIFSQKLCAWQGDRTDAQAAEALGVNLRTYHGWKNASHSPVGLALTVVLQAIDSKPNRKKS